METRASSAAADRAERQGVGPFEQVATVLKRNGAKVVTGLTGRATLQTAPPTAHLKAHPTATALIRATEA